MLETILLAVIQGLTEFFFTCIFEWAPYLDTVLVAFFGRAGRIVGGVVACRHLAGYVGSV